MAGASAMAEFNTNYYCGIGKISSVWYVFIYRDFVIRLHLTDIRSAGQNNLFLELFQYAEK